MPNTTVNVKDKTELKLDFVVVGLVNAKLNQFEFTNNLQ